MIIWWFPRSYSLVVGIRTTFRGNTPYGGWTKSWNPCETIVCRYFQGNRPSTVSQVVQDFVHPQQYDPYMIQPLLFQSLCNKSPWGLLNIDHVSCCFSWFNRPLSLRCAFCRSIHVGTKQSIKQGEERVKSAQRCQQREQHPCDMSVLQQIWPRTDTMPRISRCKSTTRTLAGLSRGLCRLNLSAPITTAFS